MKFTTAMQKTFTHIVPPEKDTLPVVAIDRRHRRGRASLAILSADMGLRKGVEIGVADGDSAIMWCESNPELQLVGIDPYMPYCGRKGAGRNESVYERASKRLAQHERITLVRTTSAEAVQEFEDDSLDLLHIDGDHSFDAVVMDLVLWVPKVRNGGLVTLHDYCPCWNAGVMAAVDAYTKCHRIEPWFVTRGEQPTAFWQKGAERI